jgi:hypothetical protein
VSPDDIRGYGRRVVTFAPRGAPTRSSFTLVLRARPWSRRLAQSQPFLLLLLSLCTLGYAVLGTQSPRWFPLASVTLLMLLGGFVLRLRWLLGYFAFLTACVWAMVHLREGPAPQPGVVVTVVVTGVLVIGYVRSRQRVGLQGTLGESMLVDLRDRLEHQGRFPVDLPEGWHVDTVLRSANGDSFSGDFVVGTYDRTGRHLEIVLIDVSGKGLAAGTRSLMLSGAFGGLVGALEPSDFLPTANRYLIRQQWPEGFVTGVHVSLDLGTGDALLAGAGHPPAVHYRAGKGRWVLLDGEQGPVLGVLDEAKFPAQRLRLERGDALMLYTDGLVESPRLDVGSGIDRLVGQAERVMTQGFRGGAAKIMDGVRSGEGDDRALVLLWRD